MSYKTSKIPPIGKRIKPVVKNEFARAVIDQNLEAFLVYIAFLAMILSVRKAHIAFLCFKKVKIV